MSFRLWPNMALGILVFLILGIAFNRCAFRMLKDNRNDRLVSVPLAPELEIVLPSTGKARLLVECPRIAAKHRSLRIALTEQQTGQTIAAEYSTVTAQGAVYGVSTMQVPFGQPALLRAGAYHARITGLDPAGDYSRYRLVLSRPYIGRLALQIVVLVLCGVGMLLDAIWVAWSNGWMKTG
jgi:hypothetical protein